MLQLEHFPHSFSKHRVLRVAFGTSIGNMGLLGIGLPIGMVIGMAVGSGMDKKAVESGKQLDLEIKY